MRWCRLPDSNKHTPKASGHPCPTETSNSGVRPDSTCLPQALACLRHPNSQDCSLFLAALAFAFSIALHHAGAHSRSFPPLTLLPFLLLPFSFPFLSFQSFLFLFLLLSALPSTVLEQLIFFLVLSCDDTSRTLSVWNCGTHGFFHSHPHFIRAMVQDHLMLQFLAVPFSGHQSRWLSLTHQI